MYNSITNKPGQELQETYELCNCKQKFLYQILRLAFSDVSCHSIKMQMILKNHTIRFYVFFV